MQEQNDSQKKHSVRRYKIPAVLLLIIIFVFSAYILLSQEAKPDPASEQAIRQAAARMLHADPNKLTDEDFVNMTRLAIASNELSDLQLIKRFTNLQELVLLVGKFPDNAIPTWMKILGKCGIIDIKKRAVIDLGPVEKLENLKIIDLTYTPVKSLKPLLKLNKLEKLSITHIDIPDFESLKKLKSIKTLNLFENPNITDKQIEELQKALPGVEITRETPFFIT